MQQAEVFGLNDDSDNDEGFVMNTLQIKHKDAIKIEGGSNSRPNDYQPRYINATSLIRRQIPQLVNSFPHFANEQQLFNQKQSRKKQSQGLTKIEESSFPNKNYQLIYQRYSKKGDLQAINTQNNISLASIVSYSADNYSVLKNWEIKINNDELVFQSRFQCGNLLYAYKNVTKSNHYVLYIQNDTNTKGYNKWFYFAVKNKKKNMNCTFSIVNFRKNFAFFKEGMKPVRYSLKDHQNSGNGWSKCGHNIHMYRSKIGNQNLNSQYYTLTFQVTLQHQNDTNFFSLLPPYSYTRLINFLSQSEKSCKQREDIKFQFKTISYSLSNTQVPYVTISSRQPSKKNIVVLARQHPGEVWSSFFAQSLMRQLFRDSFAQKQWLLKNFTFKIFPMINVDGVIYGNFRCDLVGVDLNRSWKAPNKLLHPHIVAVKQQIARLSREEQIVCCFDLHSHSKEHNIFAYCCKADNQGRLLPFLISRMSNMFYFPFCTFGISKYKESTARAVIYDIAKTPDVLTIQSSFFALNNPLKVINPASFITFSNAFLKAIKYYYSKGKQYLQAEEALPKAMAEMAALRQKNRQKYSLQQSGSDSEPECDEIAIIQKLGNILPKCSVVQVALGIVKQDKDKLEIIPKNKQISPTKPKTQVKKQQIKFSSITRNTISQQPLHQQKRVQKPPLLTTRPTLNINTKKNRLTSSLKKSDRGYLQDPKSPNTANRLTKYSLRRQDNDSLQLTPINNTTLSKFLASEFSSSNRQNGLTKYQLQFKYQKKQEQQFPLLCVLSQRKKEAHLEKLRRIHPAPSQKEKPIVRYQPTLFVNKKLDTMQKLRQRQKNSSELVSALWKQTLGYDNDGPITHIFYG